MMSIFIFLLAITTVEVIKIAMEIYSGGKCPSDTELHKFLVGQLDKDSHRGEKISRHLGTCKECQQKVTEV